MHQLVVPFVLAVGSLTIGREALAQCATQWQPGRGLPGVDGVVTHAAWWDPDGPGPSSGRAVVAGAFAMAGDQLTNNIAAYDPTNGSWSTLGVLNPLASTPFSPNFYVQSLLPLPTGELLVGVWQPPGANYTLRRWNGSSWQVLAAANGSISALARDANGDVIAAGNFTWIQGTVAQRVARWNGTSWSPLGTGCDGLVAALVLQPNGDLIAGGSFTNAGSGAANRLARWDGAAWSPLGSGTNGPVNALVVTASGQLMVGGAFTTAGGLSANRVALWNGTGWTLAGSGFGSTVSSLAAHPSGDVIAGGTFTASGSIATPYVARWNGSTWSPLGSGFGNSLYGPTQVGAVLAMPNGHTLAGGSFTVSGANTMHSAAVWSGTSWSATHPGTDAPVTALATRADGQVVAGGSFVLIEGVAAARVAVRAGNSWQALGSGITTPGGSVDAIAELGNGDLVVGGWFTTAGATSTAYVARWNGSTWSAMGAGHSAWVRALTPLGNDRVVAGGEFPGFVSLWNGSSWSPMGSGTNAAVWAAVTLPNGDVVIGGTFTTAGGAPAARIARWDGSSWQALGPGLNGPVYALAVRANGDVVAGGGFTHIGADVTPAPGVARWDGSTWQPMGLLSGAVRGLHAMPNGDVLAVGTFSPYVVRWNGSSWSIVDAGTGDFTTQVTVGPTGAIFVGGVFRRAGPHPAAMLARLATSCPTAVAVGGSGCASSGGSNTLTASNAPWVGSSFRAVASGLPGAAIAVVVTGFAAANLPLGGLLPQGQSGCALLATPDLLEVGLAVAGTVGTQIVLPNLPALAGRTLHHQVVPFDFDAAMNLLGVTATNSLVLTIGSL